MGSDNETKLDKQKDDLTYFFLFKGEYDGNHLLLKMAIKADFIAQPLCSTYLQRS